MERAGGERDYGTKGVWVNAHTNTLGPNLKIGELFQSKIINCE